MQVATDSELAQDDDVVDIEDVERESAADDADGEPTPPSKKPMAASWRPLTSRPLARSSFI